MLSIASYSLIERKLIIDNPSQFFCELKYRTIEDVYKSLRRSMDFKDNTLLHEEILRTALREKAHWTDLITNSKGIEHKNYLTKLDKCLRTLVKNKYIECNYRTKFDAKKHVLDLKIVEFNILDKGERALYEIDALKKIDIEESYSIIMKVNL